MRKRTFTSYLLLILSLLAVSSYGLEWYETGHRSILEWQNFDQAVMEKGKFKFIKFFTHNCGYCRKLKIVQQQLMAETQYSFRFHEVDCTVNYDLCSSKAAITGFPYVGVYNTHGQLHAEIRGFYPLQTMRETLIAIQQWQDYELAQTPVPAPPTSQAQVAPQQKVKQVKVEEKPSTQKISKDSKKVQTVKIQTKEVEKRHAEDKKQVPKIADTSSDWSGSIKQGVKATVIVLAVVFFNSVILPFLKKSPQQQDQGTFSNKSRTIEIPVKPKVSQSVKYENTDQSQENYLLNECI